MAEKSRIHFFIRVAASAPNFLHLDLPLSTLLHIQMRATLAYLWIGTCTLKETISLSTDYLWIIAVGPRPGRSFFVASSLQPPFSFPRPIHSFSPPLVSSAASLHFLLSFLSSSFTFSFFHSQSQSFSSFPSLSIAFSICYLAPFLPSLINLASKMASLFSFISILFLTSLASCRPQYGSPVSESYTSTSKLQEAALTATNGFRSQHGAAPVAWNDTLAGMAQTWANRCRFEHSMGALGTSGENLAYGYPDMTAAINQWGNERDLYDFKAPTGFTHATGHFTQLVWKETVSMGCAAVDCNGKGSMSGYFVVCEYRPQGNIVSGDLGYFKANVQAQGGYNAPSVVAPSPPVPSPAPPVSAPAPPPVAAPSVVSTVPSPAPIPVSTEARVVPQPADRSTVPLPPPPAAPTFTEASVPTPSPSSTSSSTSTPSPIATSLVSPTSSIISSTPTPEPTPSSATAMPVSESAVPESAEPTSTAISSTPAEASDVPLPSESAPALAPESTNTATSTEESAQEPTSESTPTESSVEVSLPTETTPVEAPADPTSAVETSTAESSASQTMAAPPFPTSFEQNSGIKLSGASSGWAMVLISLVAAWTL